MKTFYACVAAVLIPCIALAGTWMASPGKGSHASAGGAALAIVRSAKATAVLESATVSLTVDATDGNLILAFVMFGEDALTDAGIVTGVTFNGDALTAITGFGKADGSWTGVDGWYRVAPDQGSFTMTATVSPACNQLSLIAVVISGAHQTTTFGTAANASGNSTTASVATSSATGEIVLSTVSTDALTVAAVTGTSLQEVENIETDTAHGVSWAAGATTVTPSWTIEGGAFSWAISAISVKPL